MTEPLAAVSSRLRAPRIGTVSLRAPRPRAPEQADRISCRSLLVRRWTRLAHRDAEESRTRPSIVSENSRPCRLDRCGCGEGGAAAHAGGSRQHRRCCAPHSKCLDS